MRRISLILLIMLALPVREAWADVVVIIRKEAEAVGNYVRVCDIARVEGPKDQATEVGLTVLGPTPPKGQPLEISKWEIESRLFEMGVTANIVFSGNDSVRVHGSGPRLRDYAPEPELARLQPASPAPALDLGDTAAKNAAKRQGEDKGKQSAKQAQSERPIDGMTSHAKDRVGQLVSAFLSKQYQRPDVEVEAKLFSVTDAVAYSAHEIEVVEALEGRVPGRASLRLRVRDDVTSEDREVTAVVDASVFGLAPVAKRQLFPGEILDPADVAVRRVKMEAGKSYLPPSPKSVDGLEIKSGLTAGAPILASQTVPTEAVKRGDTVATEVSGTGWKIQGSAKALAGGRLGEVITVQDSSTKKKYPGRIVGRGKVSLSTKQL